MSLGMEWFAYASFAVLLGLPAGDWLQRKLRRQR